MIKLSKPLASYLCSNYFILDNRCEFDNDELERVKKIKLSKNDIESLKYFKNLEYLELDMFPSINEEDINKISFLCPYIKSLKIIEQNALFNLDVSRFPYLKELWIMHNENLLSVKGVRNLDTFIFYDNKEYENIDMLIDSITMGAINVEIDVIYYVDMVRRLLDKGKDAAILDDIKWIEVVGLRKYCITKYNGEEVKELFGIITEIVSKYIFVSDSDKVKYGVLYQWMLFNIDFINEDENKKESGKSFDNVSKVFACGKGGRLTFAKTFQLLLRVAGIKSKIVYSMGALDSIGYYDGKKVFSLVGNNDYALLRVILEDNNYYSDIAWDELVKNFIFVDEIRTFLIDKGEIKLRQKIVGEGNVKDSRSLRSDEIEEILMYVRDRINNVDTLFNVIETVNSLLVNAQVNYDFMEEEVTRSNKILGDLDQKSREYGEITFSIKSQKDLLSIYEKDKRELEIQQKEIISDYNEILKEYYLSGEEDLHHELDRKLDRFEISNSLYDILIKLEEGN